MVFTAKLRNKGFKQNLSDPSYMLNDQTSTYAVLRYNYEIPEKIYTSAMETLMGCKSAISNRKLIRLVDSYERASKVGLGWSEEHDTTVYYDPETRMMFTGNEVDYSHILVEDND